MNIAILRDKKGFQKEMVLPRFLPVIEIAVYTPLSIQEEQYTFKNEIIRFYPNGEVKQIAGANILEYREN